MFPKLNNGVVLPKADGVVVVTVVGFWKSEPTLPEELVFKNKDVAVVVTVGSAACWNKEVVAVVGAVFNGFVKDMVEFDAVYGGGCNGFANGMLVLVVAAGAANVLKPGFTDNVNAGLGVVSLMSAAG